MARRRIEVRSRGGIRREMEWDGEDPDALFEELVGDCTSEESLVLDIGCGEGHMAARVAGRASLVAGIDLSWTAIEHAAACFGGERVSWVRADALRLPFRSGCFDVAYSRRGPVVESAEALAEARRVLKPAGVLVGLVPGELHRVETQEVFGRGFHWPPARPVRFQVPELLTAAGLSLASFAEYYGVCYYPDLEAFATHLETIPVIPCFDRERDAPLLREVERKLRSDRGIRDTEHMSLFVAQKT